MADWWHDMKGKYGDFGKITIRKHSSVGVSETIGRITSPFAYPSAANYMPEGCAPLSGFATFFGSIEFDPSCRAALFGAALNEGIAIVQRHNNRARSPEDAQRNADRKRAEKRARKITRNNRK